MVGWLNVYLEGNGHGLVKVLSRHLSGWTEENREEPVMISSFLAEVQMENLSDTNLKHYSCVI